MASEGDMVVIKDDGDEQVGPGPRNILTVEQYAASLDKILQHFKDTL